MKIQLTDKKSPNTVAIPLLQADQLADQLAAIALENGLDATALQNDFKAEAKEVQVIYLPGKPVRRLYLVGLGKKASFADVQLVLRSFCHRFKSRLPLQLGIDLRHFPGGDISVLADAAVCGTLLGLYQINKNKTEAPPEKPAPAFGDGGSELSVLVNSENLGAAKEAARRAEVFAEAGFQILDLVNAPGNKKTPQKMADFAKKAGKSCGFEVKVLEKEDLIKEGLDALLAVNLGSPNPPYLILLDYVPKKWGKKAPPTLGLVGKGVTFDTGGISIKPSTNMHYMKSDMGGAAAVLGAFMVAAKLELPFRICGAIPATENMVDGKAAKPGDVFKTYSGKTIEIIDTDAEGRVILADALSYLIKNHRPETVIDLATLTGSIIRAIGTQAGGLFTQNDELASKLSRAGERVGERLWRMPMWEEYGTDLKSDVADLKNFSGKPMAESITAAKFLENFTEKHTAWAHLDIAGMAFGDSEFANGKSATGFGVRLVWSFLMGETSD